jgi:hypothetical protein
MFGDVIAVRENILTSLERRMRVVLKTAGGLSDWIRRPAATQIPSVANGDEVRGQEVEDDGLLLDKTSK